ncbi:hypothetical protein BD289DRAFT_368843 [Coniella lustricola]|uniref:DUF6314 domain-containing protein n=1 Tax=Coniella lustricola TaxID=2025994 RepID=A0A2T3A7H7_9PEZI|nr:hypothetical protein BD289DRAFT_368843 [Coniella lustricola]
MAPKSVCIIGAGPSGLVAAKTLLHHSSPASGPSFSVTVFDPQPRIGGLWPSNKADGAGLLHPLMVANQSKHTMQFSDLAWEEGSPELPRAWQVGKYLHRYLDRYCAFEGSKFHLRLGWKVEKALPRGEKERTTWLVTARSEEGLVDEAEYDYVIVASGFFGKPVMPDLPGLNASNGIPVIHSSRYRDLETLLPNADGKGGKILVVGGQMSGVEIAGTIAAHLSSAANAPGQDKLAGIDNYSVHHVIQRPTWVFPLYTSPASARADAPFAPLDLSSYNLANRPKPLSNTQGHIPVDQARTTKQIFKNLIGTDQSEFSPLLAPSDHDIEEPAYLAVSDWYTDFVRSGMITLTKGKLDSLSGTTASIVSSTSSHENASISDVAAVVLATGFEAAPSLSFLPEDVQQTLAVDPSNIDNTLLLAFHGTHHPDVSNLGFVGFYRSPYWGVMEMQARFLTELWTQQQQGQGQLRPSLHKALSQEDSIQRFAALRDDPRASQFPMGDYAWLMQQFALALDIPIQPIAAEDATPPLPHNGKPMDILTPARYLSPDADEAQQREAQLALSQTSQTALASLTKGKYVARAVFRSLLGEWQLERDLISTLPSHLSGHWSGTAKFLLRQGTKDGLACVRGDTETGSNGDIEAEADPGLEYLYIEEGEFKTTAGFAFPATRRYIWRYNESTDKLSVWFVRTGDKFSRKDPRREEEQMKADYLFHEVEFVVPPPSDNNCTAATSNAGPSFPMSSHSVANIKGWQAKAGHLCVKDFYDVKYDFKFAGVNLRDWWLGYTVKGPQKDYTISGTYTRRSRKDA